MNKQLTNEEVNAFENACREAEAKLEEIGRSICSAENGGGAWSCINESIECLQAAINQSWRMRPDC